jgi:hypothetical protein
LSDPAIRVTQLSVGGELVGDDSVRGARYAEAETLIHISRVFACEVAEPA